MDRWEYATVVSYSHTSFDNAFVRYHNGMPVSKPDALYPLVEYLNLLGAEGWETVGVMPNITENAWMILLKRKFVAAS